MVSFPNAKINLGLNIVSKRTDGYHNVETIMYPVAIKDALELSDAAVTSMEIVGNAVPGELTDNLCLRAFKLMEDHYSVPPQKITLLKKIPVGAGLGGGSADAAAVINLANTKFNLQIPVATRQSLAAQLGADCAFFIENNPVLARGTGNEFTAVELDLSKYYVMVVMPSVHVSTQLAYSLVKPEPPGYDIQKVILQPVETWRYALKNDFEEPIIEKFPIIGQIKELLYQKGALFAAMSGSGASVYGIFASKVELNIPANCVAFCGV